MKTFLDKTDEHIEIGNIIGVMKVTRLRTCKGLSILVALALVLALGAVSLALAPEVVANAATIQVINNNDSGAGSLRQAIADAILGEEITFAGTVTGTISLTSGELLVNKNVTITGPGADVLTISGNNASRVFNIGSGVTMTISGLAVVDGYNSGGHGGGIINAGTVTLNNCILSGNTAFLGGGIANFGTLTLNNCMMIRNTAPVGVGGGMVNFGTLTLNNCTISGNTAGSGGAIENVLAITLNNCTVSGNVAEHIAGGVNHNFGTVTLNNCTVSNNTAGDDGGGIYNRLGYTANVKNSIIADNNAGSAGPDFYGTLASYGCNLVQDTRDCTITGDETCNIYGQDPLLGPLKDNGGLTFTHALLEGSPAIDGVCTDCGCTAIDGTPVTTDQRGDPRPTDGDGDGTAMCDMGSYELQPPQPAGPPGVPTVNQWGVVVMIVLLGGLLVWMVRRRRFSS